MFCQMPDKHGYHYVYPKQTMMQAVTEKFCSDTYQNQKDNKTH